MFLRADAGRTRGRSRASILVLNLIVAIAATSSAALAADIQKTPDRKIPKSANSRLVEDHVIPALLWAMRR